MHLTKYLAHAGLCSRRKAIDYIKAGLVKINGVIVVDPTYQVKSEDTVVVEKKIITLEKKWYLVLNKPKDYICTLNDERGRRTVLELIDQSIKERIYPVGRLDRGTTGVLLLSNDGDLVQKLTHPKYEVQKTYRVYLDMPLKSEDAGVLMKGIELEDGLVVLDELSIAPHTQRRELIVALHSGKNRIIRRMFEALGYEVLELDRTAFATITKRDLRIGCWRHLTEDEIAQLRKLCAK